MSQVSTGFLYTTEQVRQLDYIAINDFGIDGFDLMSRAAQACFDEICQRWPDLTSMQVFCGGGNNGGDGYRIAELAHEHNIKVSVQSLKEPTTLTGDALKAWQSCEESGVFIKHFDPDASVTPEVTAEIIVDAMLGTGLSQKIRSPYTEAINQLNHSGKPVVAVDIPSGLCANTGQPLGVAVKAALTVTFIGLKQGLVTGEGADYCGDLIFAGLDVPEAIYRQVTPSCRQINKISLHGLIKPRRKSSHKGDHGHVLLVGGNHGMPGAVIMAAEAAIYSGAGRVTVATRESHVNTIVTRRPEIMAHGIHHETKHHTDLNKLLEGKNAVVIGPGLGQDDWACTLFSEALLSDCTIIIDADALNVLSENPQLRQRRKFPIILTPHPGEAARLLRTSIHKVQKDRFASVKACCKKYDAITLLKGTGTLIGCGDQVSLCNAGNPGMAVAGMGDVLSGVLGALVAQGIEPYKAVQLAAWLHASAADLLVTQQGEIGLLSTELLPVIRKLLNQINT